jgi:nucleoside-diphosphate-sugar epimerase
VIVLLTGATGFLGRSLLPVLAERHEVIALVRRPPAVRATRVRYLEADLTRLDPSSLPARADVVVHEAALLDDPFGRDPSLSDLAPVNVLGTIRLLDWAANAGVRRFVYGSTGGVTDQGPAGSAVRETAPPRPANGYGLSKHLAEQAVLTYRWPFGVVCLRYYAPYARDGSNPMVKWVLERLRRGEPIDVGADGGPTFNPIHIDDAVRLTVAAVEANRVPRVVNLAGPEVVTLARFVELLGDAIGCRPVLRYGTEPARSWVADTTRLSRWLGPPRIDVASGVMREWASDARIPAVTPGSGRFARSRRRSRPGGGNGQTSVGHHHRADR